jgi:hypothetical protein
MAAGGEVEEVTDEEWDAARRAATPVVLVEPPTGHWWTWVKQFVVSEVGADGSFVAHVEQAGWRLCTDGDDNDQSR